MQLGVTDYGATQRLVPQDGYTKDRRQRGPDKPIEGRPQSPFVQQPMKAINQGRQDQDDNRPVGRLSR